MMVAADNPRLRYAWQKIRRQVLPKPGARPCHWCGKPATEVDHLIPVAAGGTDDLPNLVPACRPCNRSKGPKTAADWQAHRAPRPRAYGAPTGPGLPLRSFATLRGDYTRKRVTPLLPAGTASQRSGSTMQYHRHQYARGRYSILGDMDRPWTGPAGTCPPDCTLPRDAD